MKRSLLLAFVILAPASYAQFGFSQLAVTLVGDGAAAPTSAAAQTRILTHSKNSATNSVAAILNGGTTGIRLTNSGTATSEGFLQLAGDGSGLTLGGYDAAIGLGSVATSSTATVKRVAAKIDFSGTVSYNSYSVYTGANIRSVWSTNGTDNYSGGSGGAEGGVNLLNATNTNIIAGSALNSRVITGFGGDLYVTSGSAATLGVNKISGNPTSSSSATVMISMATGSSPYGMFFANANTLYVADDRSTIGTGGIQKWTFSSGVWSLAYTLSTSTGGPTLSGARGLAGEVDGSGNVTLYASTVETTNSRLVRIDDLGSGSAASLLSTAGTNQVYRGVALAPVPEPASMLALGLGLVGLVAKRRRK